MPVLTQQHLKASLPDTSKSLKLNGLDSTITIYRDRYGIPHVKADSIHDAFFGQGFSTAQDRLWHMDYDRRRAYGRWAEYAGQIGLAQDVQMRHFQIGETVRTDYDSLSANTRQMLNAYVSGVNTFINSTNAIPIEYCLVGGDPEPWMPWDCLAVFKARHILMGVFESKLWRARMINALGPKRAANILQGYQPGHLLVVPPGTEYDGPVLDGLQELAKGMDSLYWLGDEDSGSNNWVLSGNRTASGKPLLAGDPHRGLDTPNVYYQNHIACPEFDVIGLSFPGCPGFPHFGHNAHVAWCVTHAGADYQDLYVERFHINDPTLYRYQDQWQQAVVRHETIEIRGHQPVELDVTITDHGPIIVGDPSDGYGIAFKYTATEVPNLGFDSVLEMLKATSASRLDDAMRYWVDPCNNLLFADIDGNIAYLNRGKVPIRTMTNAWLPVPGWTGDHEWHGYIPFEDLSRSRNPKKGYLATANNRIAGAEYPYYIALDFAPEYRVRRIQDRLESLTNATTDDMIALHADTISIPSQTYAQLLTRIQPLDETSSTARDILVNWDGNMAQDKVAPTIYSAFRYRLHTIVIEHLLGSLSNAVFKEGHCVEGQLRTLWAQLVTMARDDDTSLLPPGTDWVSVAAQALYEGVADLRATLGHDMTKWLWGRLHHTRPRHTLSASFPELASILNPPQIPMSGDGDTPQAGSYCSLDPFVMTSMSVSRYVFDIADWNNSAWISPLGASGHPGSPHYSDQSSIWAELKLVPMLYDWDNIKIHATSNQTLAPI